MALVEKKESLISQIATIDKELTQAFSGKPVVETAKVPKTRKARKGKKGSIGEAILSLLSEAGKSGLSTADLAKKSGKKPGSVHNWIATAGLKSGKIERAERGVYRLKA